MNWYEDFYHVRLRHLKRSRSANEQVETTGVFYRMAERILAITSIALQG